MIEVMLDLETMSLRHNAAIIAIGAVKFDPRAPVGALGDTFYRKVRLSSSEEAGLHMSASTIAWWMEQSDDARKATFGDDAVELDTALSGFFDWFGPTSRPTWGNGAGFDNVILRNAYRVLGGYCPFNYKDDRCYRTINALYPNTAFVQPEVKHDALQDAMAQAVHLQKLFNFIARG